MKTLRAKLFVNIGAILLLTAVLNTVVAERWIKKELLSAGLGINNHVEEIQEKIRQFSSFLLTFEIVKEAAELERLTQTSELSFTDKSLWEEAKTIISYNPSISFVQIQDQEGKSACISPQGTTLHSFSWSEGKEGFLWVKQNMQSPLFVAIPEEINGQTLYFLFDDREIKNTSMKKLEEFASPLKEKLILAKKSSLKKEALFSTTAPISYSYEWKGSAVHLFQTLLSYQNQWLEKINMISALLPWQETLQPLSPYGALKISQDRKEGFLLFSKDLFSSTPLTQNSPLKKPQEAPFLLLRQTAEESDLDVVEMISFSNQGKHTLTLGFSLSQILKQLALLTEKTIIACGEGITVGFTSTGEGFDPQKTQFPFDQTEGDNHFISWQKEPYFFSTIDLEVLKLFILTPKEQALSMTHFLETVSQEITFKISLSLLLAALFSFTIALLLLSNISKKITNPIAILSKASEELSHGNYENLILPKINKRDDEVSTLAHSFQGMVTSLQDRDKIRGILNKVVSKEISEQILKNNIELRGEEKILSLLFSDIRNFTKLAEGIPPHSLIDILNAYMTRMCRIIDATHGVVDKFVGDEIMTLYGAPLPLDFHAAKAIKAALWMVQDLSEWNQERLQKKEPIFEIGIGIHTGLVYTGNMGAENRLNYTAIGSNVNQASRICSIASPMQILISEETLKQPSVLETFKVQKLKPVLLKGIEHPVQVYEVTGLISLS